MDGIEVAREGILIGCSSMIGNFKLDPVLGGIVEEVDVAAAVEAVMLWFLTRVVEIVVDVREARLGVSG